MPQFVYRAKNSDLQHIDGTIDADNEAAAISRLGAQGIFPFSIQESGAAEAAREGWLGRRVGPKNLALTTRQLADLIAGGLPLLNALNVLARQTENPRMRRVVESVARSVRDGRSFSDALTDHPDVFPSLYVSMVRAGEVGGGLEKVLNRLADLGEQEAELRSRLVNAALYPVIVLLLAAALVIGMMVWVIPTLAEVFSESGQALPLPTRLVMGVSQGVRYWWWAWLLGLAALIWSTIQWRRSEAGREAFARLVLRMPGFGALIRRINVARFARTLGVMLGQGVPVLQALEIVAENVGNAVLRRAILDAQQSIRNGASIAFALEITKEFPPFVSNMVAVGEESGQADQSLLKVAEAYEREADRTVKTLTTILEPLLLVFIGGVVMLVVLAMLLPIFQIGLMIE